LAKEAHTHLKNWSEADCPHERLLRQSADALSADAQFLGIILRTGTDGRTAVTRQRLVQAATSSASGSSTMSSSAMEIISVLKTTG
jgi:DNA repair protein RadC